MDRYLISLASDYVDLVDAMRTGRYCAEDLRQLDSQRQVAHRQLASYAGLSLSEDAYRYARSVLHAARAGGY
jgi:hypothetical protein